MKSLTSLLMIIFAVILLIACSSKDRTVDTTVDTSKLLISVGSSMPKLTLIMHSTGEVIRDDVFSDNNGTALPGTVTKIYQFGQYIYLVIPDAKVIDVIDKDSFKLKNTIDFTSLGYIPVDICFANATTAYIAHSNTNIITVYDIYNSKIAQSITINKKSNAIACSGNQIFIANSADNQITVVDSRTNAMTNEIAVSAVPAFIDFSPDGLKAIIVSIGTGKTDGGSTKSSAVATEIDISTKSILFTKALDVGTYSSIDQVPVGLAVNSKSYLFIPTQTLLLRLDIKALSKVDNEQKLQFCSSFFNSVTDELLLIGIDKNAYNLYLCDPTSGKTNKSFSIPTNSVAVYPMYSTALYN